MFLDRNRLLYPPPLKARRSGETFCDCLRASRLNGTVFAFSPFTHRKQVIAVMLQSCCSHTVTLQYAQLGWHSVANISLIRHHQYRSTPNVWRASWATFFIGCANRLPVALSPIAYHWEGLSVKRLSSFRSSLSLLSATDKVIRFVETFVDKVIKSGLRECS